MNKPEIFLSYAWGGESEKIVNELDNTFIEKGIILVRDKRDLGFKGMITDFMKRIGEGKAVIAVISNKYLKSPYCMFELLEIYRNLNFQEKIFPIVLDDAKIFEPLTRLTYLKFWQDKKKELDDAIMQFGTDAITVIGDDYKTYKKVFDNFGEVVNILKDINSLTPQMHRDDKYAVLLETIMNTISKNESSSKFDYTNINKIDIDGNGNIVLQDVNGGNITVNYNDTEAIKKLLQNISDSQTIELKQIIASKNKDVLTEIRKTQEQIDKQNTENKINLYTADIDEFLKELKMNDINAVKKRVLRDYSMLHEYEDMLILEDDPMRKERYKLQIENIKTNISNGEKALLNIAKQD